MIKDWVLALVIAILFLIMMGSLTYFFVGF